MPPSVMGSERPTWKASVEGKGRLLKPIAADTCRGAKARGHVPLLGPVTHVAHQRSIWIPSSTMRPGGMEK